MTVYAHKAFRLLCDKDTDMVNPYESLDPVANHSKIQSFRGPDGGKSGEFFFFTDDNKLIIKTLSDAELRAFKLRIGAYFAHVLK